MAEAQHNNRSHTGSGSRYRYLSFPAGTGRAAGSTNVPPESSGGNGDKDISGFAYSSRRIHLRRQKVHITKMEAGTQRLINLHHLLIGELPNILANPALINGTNLLQHEK